MDKERREKYLLWLKRGILVECLLAAAVAFAVKSGNDAAREIASGNVLTIENDYIKWVDFTVSYEALCKAYDWDVKTHGTEHEIDWVELLAYTAARTGGNFDKSALKILEKAAKTLAEGDKTLEEMTADLKYFNYYKEAYGAALGGLVGEYQVEVRQTAGQGGAGKAFDGTDLNGAESHVLTGSQNAEMGYESVYGLKGYFPLARGFDYTHYDDFGVARSYGYKRQHLGAYVIIVSSW